MVSKPCPPKSYFTRWWPHLILSTLQISNYGRAEGVLSPTMEYCEEVIRQDYKGYDSRLEDMNDKDQGRKFICIRLLFSFSYQYYYYYSPTILFFNSTSTCCFLLLVIILFVSFLHYFLHGFFTTAFPFLTDFDMLYLSQGLSKTTSLPSECKGKAVYTLTRFHLWDYTEHILVVFRYIRK